MAKVNENYLKLKAGYLFPEIGRRVSAYKTAHPSSDVIRLGIGDVTLPLSPGIIEALHRGVDEMAKKETFKGYGPEQGYEFLRNAIAENDYKARGVDIDASEIFISDGSKCDTGNLQEIFSSKAMIAVTDPVYPVYVDTNVMAGRTGLLGKNGMYGKMVYLPCHLKNGFCPPLPKKGVDLLYLCSPNNPTGAVMTKEQLKGFVDYARANKAILLFDAAYEAYITDPALPHSIFEIEGAKECAIEFRSFSKNAGFTGLRCAFTVIPKNLSAFTSKGEAVNLHTLWNRRHCTKFNGVSYPVQCAAAAVYSPQGKKEVREMVNYYLTNASIIEKNLNDLSIKTSGGKNAPYIWLKIPGKKTSWEFFDQLLSEAEIVGTPGSGFGPSGEGYFRLSSFGARSDVERAMERFKTRLKL